jgi:hypothetical protein
MTSLKRICSLIVAALCTSAFAADLPFVEVDQSTTTALRLRGTDRPYVAVGVNYFDHMTGWAPQIWRRFDPERVGKHLDMIRDNGFNAIRVFLTQNSFHREPGVVREEGAAKFEQLLAMCRERGIYVMPTGPDHWEGVPEWRNGDQYADERILDAEERWWRAFAARFADEPALLAWDLFNEPTVKWNTPSMREKWNRWLAQEYGSVEKIAAAWTRPADEIGEMGRIDVPPAEPALNDTRLYDYQRFRESIGEAWVRRHVRAIRAADPNHMITIGHIQWAGPIKLPTVQQYAGFDMKATAEMLDFVTIHFYPTDLPRPCDGPEGVVNNAAYLEALLLECSVGKPLMVGEFNWYGGGGLDGDDFWQLPPRPVEHQVEWCQKLLEVSRGRACGWLNWAFADTPTSRDITRWSGLWTEDLQLKPWGRVFSEFAREITAHPASERPFPDYLTSFDFDEKAMLTTPATGDGYRRQLHRAMP